MKKILPILIISLFAAASCSEETDPQNIETDPKEPLTGSVRFIPSFGGVNMSIEELRTRSIPEDIYPDDFSDYIIALESHATGKTVKHSFPEDGLMEGLDVGVYSYSFRPNDDFGYPRFNLPFWYKVDSFVVEPAKVTEINIDLAFYYHGLFFEYDESLRDAGLWDIVPFLPFTYSDMIYKDENRDAIGYYVQYATLDIYMLLNDEYVLIDGELCKRISFVPDGKLWKIILSANSTRSAGEPAGITTTLVEIE